MEAGKGSLPLKVFLITELNNFSVYEYFFIESIKYFACLNLRTFLYWDRPSLLAQTDLSPSILLSQSAPPHSGSKLRCPVDSVTPVVVRVSWFWLSICLTPVFLNTTSLFCFYIVSSKISWLAPFIKGVSFLTQFAESVHVYSHLYF